MADSACLVVNRLRVNNSLTRYSITHRSDAAQYFTLANSRTLAPGISTSSLV